jgi:hypothetical protein
LSGFQGRIKAPSGEAGRSPVEGKMKSVVGVLGRVSTQTLLQIIVVLAATVAMKAYLVFM